MTKICTKCNIEKDEQDFRIRNKSKNKRSCWCKSCFSLYEREKWKNSPTVRSRHNDQLNSRRIRNSQYVWDFLKLHPCVDCGNSNPIVLEFDHRNPNDKSYNICDLTFNASNIDLLKIEIDKCDVVCSNCHKIRTAKQFDFYKNIIK